MTFLNYEDDKKKGLLHKAQFKTILRFLEKLHNDSFDKFANSSEIVESTMNYLSTLIYPITSYGSNIISVDNIRGFEKYPTDYIFVLTPDRDVTPQSFHMEGLGTIALTFDSNANSKSFVKGKSYKLIIKNNEAKVMTIITKLNSRDMDDELSNNISNLDNSISQSDYMKHNRPLPDSFTSVDTDVNNELDNMDNNVTDYNDNKEYNHYLDIFTSYSERGTDTFNDASNITSLADFLSNFDPSDLKTDYDSFATNEQSFYTDLESDDITNGIKSITETTQTEVDRTAEVLAEVDKIVALKNGLIDKNKVDGYYELMGDSIPIGNLTFNVYDIGYSHGNNADITPMVFIRNHPLSSTTAVNVSSGTRLCTLNEQYLTSQDIVAYPDDIIIGCHSNTEVIDGFNVVTGELPVLTSQVLGGSIKDGSKFMISHDVGANPRVMSSSVTSNNDGTTTTHFSSLNIDIISPYSYIFEYPNKRLVVQISNNKWYLVGYTGLDGKVDSKNIKNIAKIYKILILGLSEFEHKKATQLSQYQQNIDTHKTNIDNETPYNISATSNDTNNNYNTYSSNTTTATDTLNKLNGIINDSLTNSDYDTHKKNLDDLFSQIQDKNTADDWDTNSIFLKLNFPDTIITPNLKSNRLYMERYWDGISSLERTIGQYDNTLIHTSQSLDDEKKKIDKTISDLEAELANTRTDEIDTLYETFNHDEVVPDGVQPRLLTIEQINQLRRNIEYYEQMMYNPSAILPLTPARRTSENISYYSTTSTIYQRHEDDKNERMIELLATDAGPLHTPTNRKVVDPDMDVDPGTVLLNADPAIDYINVYDNGDRVTLRHVCGEDMVYVHDAHASSFEEPQMGRQVVNPNYGSTAKYGGAIKVAGDRIVYFVRDYRSQLYLLDGNDGKVKYASSDYNDIVRYRTKSVADGLAKVYGQDFIETPTGEQIPITPSSDDNDEIHIIMNFKDNKPAYLLYVYPHDTKGEIRKYDIQNQKSITLTFPESIGMPTQYMRNGSYVVRTLSSLSIYDKFNNPICVDIPFPDLEISKCIVGNGITEESVVGFYSSHFTFVNPYAYAMYYHNVQSLHKAYAEKRRQYDL